MQKITKGRKGSVSFIYIILLLIPVLTFSQMRVKLGDIPKVNKVTVTNTGVTYNLDIKPPQTIEKTIGKSALTNNVAIYNEVTYPVYVTEKGTQFIVIPDTKKDGYKRKSIPKQYY